MLHLKGNNYSDVVYLQTVHFVISKSFKKGSAVETLVTITFKSDDGTKSATRDFPVHCSVKVRGNLPSDLNINTVNQYG